MTLPDWWPVATRRPVPNTASPHPGEGAHLYDVAGRFTQAPLGWVLHVVVGNGSPYGTFVGAKSPKRRFSHLWIAKDGDVEQYGPFDHKSWANGTGNGLYYSCETEGFPTEPLTSAQIHRLAEFHIFSGAVDRIAGAVGEKGIICHYQGGADWGGHSCPDPAPGGQGPRSHQRDDILAVVAKLRGGDKPKRPTIHGPIRYGDHGADVKTVQHRLDQQLGVKVDIDGQFGRATLIAVEDWQRHHKLTPDGIVGPVTAKSMGFTYTAK